MDRRWIVNMAAKVNLKYLAIDGKGQFAPDVETRLEPLPEQRFRITEICINSTSSGRCIARGDKLKMR